MVLKTKNLLLAKLSMVKRRTPAHHYNSTLQQEAARKLGFTTRKTMMIAQQLYEGVEVEGEALLD